MTTVTVTRTADSLADVADFLQAEADKARATSKQNHLTQKDRRQYMGRSQGLEFAATVVRETTIRGTP